MVRDAQPLPELQDVSSLLSAVGSRRSAQGGLARPCCGSSRSRKNRSVPRSVRRRLLREREKRGSCVGKTKRGKGTKIMAVTDGNGLPVAIRTTSASPHEVTLLEETLDDAFLDELAPRLIGDKAYDSDKLDQRLLEERDIELIAPNRANRSKTQDGRPLRRYKRRWKVERLFAWLQNYRRLVTRWEFHAENFNGFIHLGCILIFLRQF